jgi:hypothetical protein
MNFQDRVHFHTGYFILRPIRYTNDMGISQRAHREENRAKKLTEKRTEPKGSQTIKSKKGSQK